MSSSSRGATIHRAPSGGPGTRPPAALLALLAGLLALPGVAARPDSAAAALIRVPEDRPSLDQAVNQAVDGDTISLATGTYTRIPAPIAKAIVLRGRGAAPEETILPGLTVGRARIENLTFQLPPPPLAGVVLVEATDSLVIADCLFRASAIGVTARVPLLATDSRLMIERCRFEDLLEAVTIETNSALGPRVELLDCTVSRPLRGISLVRQPEACEGSGAPPPPEISEAAALLRLTGCLFEDVEDVAVSLSMLDDGVVAEQCTFRRCETPLRLRVSGASLRACTLTGTSQVGRGIDAEGARIDLRGCAISGFEYGIAGFPSGSCRDSGGRIGPTLEESNLLGGNAIALAGGAAFAADYNSWGLVTCEGVNSLLEPTDTGSPRVRILLDELGDPVADCSTAVETSTWGGLKARFAGSEAHH